jgi:hypothetical protein
MIFQSAFLPGDGPIAGLTKGIISQSLSTGQFDQKI